MPPLPMMVAVILQVHYEDGVDIASTTNPNHSTYVAMENSADTVKIGARGGINYFGGIIDEVRISDVERSADWISTQYNTQDDPSSFYTATVEALSIIEETDTPSITDSATLVQMIIPSDTPSITDSVATSPNILTSDTPSITDSVATSPNILQILHPLLIV
jgi:hypothetical protein